MKSVLVTGASGFIGSHCLLPLVNKGFKVHAVSRKPSRHDLNGVQFHEVDLLERQQVLNLVAKVRPTHLLHLGWYAVPGKYWTSEQNLRWVQASLDLIEAFAAAGGRRVVAAGSCAEYAWGDIKPFSEADSCLSPATLYGNCKHALRIILESFAKQAQLSVAWGRIFFLYGPREHENRLVASVIRALLIGDEARCTHGEQVRDILYVEDVADAFVKLLDSEVEGPINVGAGQPTKLKDVVNEIGRQLGRPDLIKLNAIPAPENEPACILADTTRVRSELSWQPGHTLSEGIAKTIDWWRLQQSAGRDSKSSSSSSQT